MSTFQSIEEVLKAYPTLTRDGMTSSEPVPITVEADGEAIGVSRVWIRRNFATALKPGRAKWRSSYWLKHRVEADCRGVYVSNGAFIVAMMLEGYGIERFDPKTPNVDYFVAFRKDAAA